MIRETSLDAYAAIKASGLLSKRHWQVYETLFNNGPLTGREVFNKIDSEGFTTHTAARLTELRNMGCIKEVGTKVCSITGMRVIEWAVTDELPKKFEKKKTKDDIIKELQEEIKQLKLKLGEQ